jgi:recombination protein RecR
MQFSSRAVEKLVEELNKFPGIGRKSAQRLALYLLKIPRDEALALAEAIRSVKEDVRACSVCGNFTEEDSCLLCLDPKRSRDVLCVVEQPMDVLAVEASGGFRGQYHVLRGALNPLENVGPDDIRARELVARVEGGEFREVILATNPNPPGEATAHFLAELLRPFPVHVSRIARGIPVGGDLEYADQATLARAFEGRKGMDDTP